MGVAKIRDRLGLSPLADSVMDSVENGASRIYCFPVKATTGIPVDTTVKADFYLYGDLCFEDAVLLR